MFEQFQQVENFFQSRNEYGMKPGLDRIHKLLELLGNPQEKVKAIHVAGTNGKGSTVQYINNALISNGIYAGVFTSPSLNGLTGHIYKGNNMISEIVLTEIINEVHPFVQQLDAENNHPTEFEIMTAAAFLYFEKNVDIALIETGMGGKDDTTNCFKPILSIITNVEQDHIAFLGESLESIASHKAGIIKENRPVVIGEMSDDAKSVIMKEASLKHAPLYQLTKTFNYSILHEESTYQAFQWVLSQGQKQKLKVSIQTKGEHQVKNTSLALMALKLLESNGFSLNVEKSLNGLYETQVPGRFELLQTNPVVILDGAHNPASVRAFTKTIESIYKNKKKHLIFAAFRDKDLKYMLDHLSNHFLSITLTTFKHPRAASVEELQSIINHPDVRTNHDWKKVIEGIPDQDNEVCYFVTGSLHFIGNVRNILK
ncbi:bifunctional folylpolyglutamate synthase/dihydrofolate synthase [Virgibacillus salinus]|uniref:tetrahydrofolate synthase n=1 Tax=Virgibacillus salinus TaxID=553311 RepID=A0A1H1B2I2_9BACI|nr:folylpolyglutamate synthase/dihydrofolate synthase family protein [Virgibacillus salinus]SDQ46123.1 dihydrofolate synthase / folylpolyglutamate synthase [Virgibacillus salinus]